MSHGQDYLYACTSNSPQNQYNRETASTSTARLFISPPELVLGVLSVRVAGVVFELVGWSGVLVSSMLHKAI